MITWEMNLKDEKVIVQALGSADSHRIMGVKVLQA